jgi:hypothetical protein
LGWKVAASNLQYYLDGRKLPKKISRRWLRSFRKVRNAEARIRGYFQKDLILYEINIRGFKKRGNSKTTLHLSTYFEGKIDYKGWGFSIEELFFAIGNSYIKTGGNFTAIVDGENITVSGIVTHMWQDKYDFHDGLGVLIPGFGYIPDADMKKLATKGKAREYRLESIWHQSLSAKFKVGDSNSQINWNWGLVF